MRCVVKIGSSLLTQPGAGLWNERLEYYVSEIHQNLTGGDQIVLVSSGAVAAGYQQAGYSERPRDITEKQCAAAVGQGALIHGYSEAFGKLDTTVAQILLTRRDFSVHRSFENARNTFHALLERGILPIVNENDTVAVHELTFGDNDMLGALVAALVDADRYLILTDIDGLYDSNPRQNPQATRITHVDAITPEILNIASPRGSDVGTGGMRAKVKAAELALALGIEVFIGRATEYGDLSRILEGAGAGTYFGVPTQGSLKERKRWIAFYAEPAGQVVVDEGAQRALVSQGRSLLPIGVQSISGRFQPGDVIEVRSLEGLIIGRGITNYTSDLLEEALGKQSTEIVNDHKQEKPEVIHRDYWVCLLEQTISAERNNDHE